MAKNEKDKELKNPKAQSTEGLVDDQEKELTESPPITSAKNEKAKKYKLKDPNTQYAEGSFSLVGDQEKELPDNPSPYLLARIEAGFIVEVK